MAIFVTGDTHRDKDIAKLEAFDRSRTFMKEDLLIVCGDFGAVWNDGADERIIAGWERRPYSVAFVDGNHENHTALNQYDVQTWNGGWVHEIAPHVRHLMRGQVFELEGKRFFTFGGAETTDRERRTSGSSWWAEEMPNKKEMFFAEHNLEKAGWHVDYVITHCLTEKGQQVLGLNTKDRNALTDFLGKLEDKLAFEHWFCGHYHADLTSEKYTVLYQNVLRII